MKTHSTLVTPNSTSLHPSAINAYLEYSCQLVNDKLITFDTYKRRGMRVSCLTGERLLSVVYAKRCQSNTSDARR